MPVASALSATFHGGGLVTNDAGVSPHLLIPKTRAAFLCCVAKNDDARAPTDKDTLKAASPPRGGRRRSRSIRQITAGACREARSTTWKPPKGVGRADQALQGQPRLTARLARAAASCAAARLVYLPEQQPRRPLIAR